MSNPDVIIDVTDDVEVGMILGGWGIEQPLLIRSDGIVCSKQHNKNDDRVNTMPKYPQVNNITHQLTTHICMCV